MCIIHSVFIELVIDAFNILERCKVPVSFVSEDSMFSSHIIDIGV
jgi:hypothetical protein